MTESAGTPFGYDMFEKMWGMFREGPFAAQFAAPFSMPGVGAAPSLSMMSNLVAPLTNIEELDKRIEEMRAVEQWLKLNLNMLQSAIQALEVQRATLTALRAFGAFAQSSVAAAAEAGAAVTRESTRAAESAADVTRQAAPGPAQTHAPAGVAGRDGGGGGGGGTGSRHGSAETASPGTASDAAAADPAAAMSAAFDPNGWWNLLQSQFNQIASLAAASTAAGNAPEAKAPGASGTPASAKGKATDAGGTRARPAGKSPSAGGGGAAKTARKPSAGARTKPAAK